MAKIDIYQAVTDRILELLDQGTVPWRHPITPGRGGGLRIETICDSLNLLVFIKRLLQRDFRKEPLFLGVAVLGEDYNTSSNRTLSLFFAKYDH